MFTNPEDHRKDIPAAALRLLLTVPQAAGLLELSRAKVYELVARGDIPSVKIDGSRRIRAVDLERYVADLAEADADAYANGRASRSST